MSVQTNVTTTMGIFTTNNNDDAGNGGHDGDGVGGDDDDDDAADDDDDDDVDNNGDDFQVVMKLGWKPKYQPFEVLPLVLSAGGQDPELFEIPPELILEVNLKHPK